MRLALMMACLLATQTLAVGTAHSISPCSYQGSPWGCNNTYGCAWDDYRGYCYEVGGGGGDYRSCFDINSPLECSNRDDCYWSRRANGCVSNNGGDGGYRPGLCYNIPSRWECAQQYGCHWSNAFNRCVGRDDS